AKALLSIFFGVKTKASECNFINGMFEKPAPNKKLSFNTLTMVINGLKDVFPSLIQLLSDLFYILQIKNPNLNSDELQLQSCFSILTLQ
ncbi:hypothetical protein, partial [Escherichia coli]|uniref:hypothetical protein n=1 Tax=Escherichia coli TaxID=562 RepID=UPI001BDB7D1A